MAAFGVAAQLVLAGSLRVFVPGTPASGAGPSTSSVNREVALAAVYVAGAFAGLGVAHGLIDVDHASARSIAFSAMLLLHLAGVTAHTSAGPRLHPAYRLWMPFQGGFAFVIAQGFGWMLNATSAVLLGMLYYSRETDVPAAMRVLVPMSVSAQAMLLCSLYLFDGGIPATGELRRCESLAARALCASAFVVTSGAEAAPGAFLMPGTFDVPKRAACAVAVVAGAVAVAATHASGRKLKGWHMFQPFAGGTAFVVAQAQGWTAYGTALLAQIVLLRNPDASRGLFTVPAGTVLLAHEALSYSLGLFEPSTFTTSSGKAFSGSSAGAAAVALGAAALLIGADVLRSQPAHASLAQTLLMCGTAAVAVAAAITIAVGRRRYGTAYRVFQPFAGGPEFILLQAIGWTLCGVALLVLGTCVHVGARNVQVDGLLPGAVIAALFAHGSLIASTSRFVPPSRVTAAKRTVWDMLPWRHVFSALVAVSQCALFVVADLTLATFGPSFPALPLVAAATVIVFASVPVSFWIQGRHRAGTVPGLEEHSVMQLLGWTLWSFSVVMGSTLALHSCALQLWGCIGEHAEGLGFNAAAWDQHSGGDASSTHAGLLSCTGASGLVAQALILSSFMLESLAGGHGATFKPLANLTGRRSAGPYTLSAAVLAAAFMVARPSVPWAAVVTVSLSLMLLTWAVLVARIAWRCTESRVTECAPALKGWERHNADVAAVEAQFARFLRDRTPGQKVSLNRSRSGANESNRTGDPLYKKGPNALRVDVSRLDEVIAVDHDAMVVHVEPGLPMDELARVCLAHGVVPQVMLEFPGITAGGAVSGGGIESSSHKYGSFFDTIAECDVLAADGGLLRGVSRRHERDLFESLNASYGTQGIITRLAVRVERATPYVHVRYLHFASLEAATEAMERMSNDEGAPEFVDGVALAPNSSMAVIGDPCDAPPPGVPLRSLRGNRWDAWFFWHLTDLSRRLPALEAAAGREAAGHEEYMPLDDFLFRFDRGAFWMARHGLRLFYGRHAYAESGPTCGPSLLVRLKYAWLCTTRQLYRMLHHVGDETLARMYVVQDFIMPGREQACALARRTDQPDVGVWPLWICPVRMVDDRHRSNAGFGFPVQQTAKGGMMFNVGVYGKPNGEEDFDPLVLNCSLEGRVSELGGRKMLYAQSFYTEPEFWALFDRAAYERNRERYGGASVFPDVATKLLLPAGKRESYGGVREVSFGACWRPMLRWYLSLWAEAVVPRALHARLGLQHTAMVQYKLAS